MAGSHLLLGDEDLYRDNRPPTPPLTAAPPPPRQGNAPCAPASTVNYKGTEFQTKKHLMAEFKTFYM